MKIKAESKEHTDKLQDYFDHITTVLAQHIAVVKDDTPSAMIYYLKGVFYYLRLVDGHPKHYISLNACCKGKILDVSSNRTRTSVVSAASELENFIKFVEESK
ncbi:hypothetical protein VP249E411_P0184 [Vibrio phage 249E41-1]|nr:hypothetical protein VP249E411_P0184 [Vibrio phage 249E41-1]